MANYNAIVMDRTAMHFAESDCMIAQSTILSFVNYSGGGIISNLAGNVYPEEKNMETYQGLRLTDRWYSVRLVDSYTKGVPRTGITFGMVTVGYGFEGAGVETNMPVLVTDWAEQGGGDFWLKIGLTEFANYGKYTIRVSPISPGNFADRSFVVEVLNPELVLDSNLPSHTVVGSLGQRLQAIWTGTAQAGAINSIQLDVGASAINDFYKDTTILITGGLGVHQSRTIIAYDGGTKIAILNRAWDVNPNNTSEFVITPSSDIIISNQGIAQAGGASTIQLATTAVAADDYYIGSIVYISSGLGAGQARLITGYTGIGTTASVYPAWITAPNNTSVYKVIPLGSSMIEGIDPALQALVVTILVNAFHDEDLALHLGAIIDNRTIGGLLAQLRLSKYANVEMVRATSAVPAQGITLPMAASGVIQYEIVRISLTRNFAVPDFTYYDLWRYDANQIVVEVKASLGIIW